MLETKHAERQVKHLASTFDKPHPASGPGEPDRSGGSGCDAERRCWSLSLVKTCWIAVNDHQYRDTSVLGSETAARAPPLNDQSQLFRANHSL